MPGGPAGLMTGFKPDSSVTRPVRGNGRVSGFMPDFRINFGVKMKLYLSSFYRHVLAVFLLLAGSCIVIGQFPFNGPVDDQPRTGWDYSRDVEVEGGFAYVATMETGLRVVDVSQPSNPVEAGYSDLPGYVFAVTVEGDHAYVCTNIITYPNIGGYLYILDVSNPESPVVRGYAHIPGFAVAVDIDGDYACICVKMVDYAQSSGYLFVFDVADKMNPRQTGSCPLPGDNAMDVAVSSGHAYVANEAFGIRVVDISSPSRPVEIGFWQGAGHAEAVAVDKEFAYVAVEDIASRTGSLVVLDVSDPAAPVEKQSLIMPGYAYDIAVAEGYACVAAWSAGLRVVDVHDPANVKEVGHYSMPGWAEGVAVLGGYAYVISGQERNYTGSLLVIDLSDPEKPVERGRYDRPADERDDFGSPFGRP